MYLMLDFDYYNIAENELKRFSNAVRCCVKFSVKDSSSKKIKNKEFAQRDSAQIPCIDVSLYNDISNYTFDIKINLLVILVFFLQINP